MTSNTQPNLICYTVIPSKQEGEKPIWKAIGAAFHHRDGKGFNIELDALPLNGKLVLLPPKPKNAS